MTSHGDSSIKRTQPTYAAQASYTCTSRLTRRIANAVCFFTDSSIELPLNACHSHLACGPTRTSPNASRYVLRYGLLKSFETVCNAKWIGFRNISGHCFSTCIINDERLKLLISTSRWQRLSVARLQTSVNGRAANSHTNHGGDANHGAESAEKHHLYRQRVHARIRGSHFSDVAFLGLVVVDVVPCIHRITRMNSTVRRRKRTRIGVGIRHIVAGDPVMVAAPSFLAARPRGPRTVPFLAVLAL